MVGTFFFEAADDSTALQNAEPRRQDRPLAPSTLRAAVNDDPVAQGVELVKAGRVGVERRVIVVAATGWRQNRKPRLAGRIETPGCNPQQSVGLCLAAVFFVDAQQLLDRDRLGPAAFARLGCDRARRGRRGIGRSTIRGRPAGALRSHSRHLRQPSVMGGRLQVGQRLDADAWWMRAAVFGPFRDRRQFLFGLVHAAELLELARPPVLANRSRRAGQRRADARQLRQPDRSLGGKDVMDRPWQAAYGLGSRPIGLAER